MECGAGDLCRIPGCVGTIGQCSGGRCEGSEALWWRIDVEAHIEVLHDISGHADQNGLLTWALAFWCVPGLSSFAVHGNDDVRRPLCRAHRRKDTGVPAKAPFFRL
ncbi:MAG: MBL fold metallo-hydrolase RNA specificity domain-containing protein [Clostridium sp.]